MMHMCYSLVPKYVRHLVKKEKPTCNLQAPDITTIVHTYSSQVNGNDV